MRILGVDPGSRFLGYGCIDGIGSRIQHVAHGTLSLVRGGGKETPTLEERLLAIYDGLSQVIREFKPQIMAVEKVFFAKNVLSALKLGQARGAVILTGKIHSLGFAEYSATEVKQVVTGYGQADKEQVSKMIRILTGQTEFSTYDASDGLALAICHSYSSQNPVHYQHSGKRKLSMAESVGIKIHKKI